MDASRPSGLTSGYNSAVERLRETEYPMLNGSVYLDHAGTTLYPKSLVDEFAAEMTSSLLGNPHSASPSSQLSTVRIEDTRLRALQFLNADPAEFDLVFVANATAGIKLVAEALRAAPGGFNYAYHQSAHTSLVGVREEARASVCLDDVAVEDWLAGETPFQHHGERVPTTLFAYAAQSNMDGRRYPLTWSRLLRNLDRPSGSTCLTILDAAALAPTGPLDLTSSDTAADFTVVSFSKVFGFPDLGALIVRRQAFSVFDFRRYFGGGTVDTVVTKKEQWHAPKAQRLHERLEDGTLPVHSIIALDIAMRTHARLFGSMSGVASHVSFLAQRLREGLQRLRHHNGMEVCKIYLPHHISTAPSAGPTIAFNIRNQAGAWISLAEVEKLASLKNFHIRTGGVCNPGGVASALDLEPWEIKRNFSAGFRCGSENDIIAGKPSGVVRVSLGAMSSIGDVDAFVAFIAEFYCEQARPGIAPRDMAPSETESQPDLFVAGITVYPIKSCGGFHVQRDADWEVRPEGLCWDREWCLLHKGSGHALSQKRYPKMALIKPFLDFETGQLRVTYTGKLADPSQPPTICVPLSSYPALFHASPSSSTPQGALSSRVCGEEIAAKTYVSDEINEFFTKVLDVPCVLARFPPGGQAANKSARHSKAHLQRHQMNHSGQGSSYRSSLLPSVLTTTPPSPPDSDVEQNSRQKILLSNESPILAINTASLRALNEEIVKNGGKEIPSTVFRANIILDSPGSEIKGLKLAYVEDNWSRVRIGQQDFKMLGSCRRCHMVCINQDTAEKSLEPFVTLSKTRRFDGKVFFGTHMCHMPEKGQASAVSTRESQYPTVRVGDPVVVD